MNPNNVTSSMRAAPAGMEFLRRKAELGARAPKPAEARELLDLADSEN